MKKTLLRLIALTLICALLTGCGADLSRYSDALYEAWGSADPEMLKKAITDAGYTVIE